MSKKTIISLILVLLFSVIPCLAEFEVTDMTGRTISVAEPVERIVSLSAADCEMLYAIGAGDLISARGEFCDYPEEILALPSVQTGYEMNIEQIIALEPQLVIMTKMGQTVEQVEAITNAGIPVFVSDAQTIDDMYTNITLLGDIAGKQSEAAALNDELRAGFEAIKHDSSGKTVYFEVSPLEWGLWTAGKGTFLDEIASMAGVENVFTDVEGWASVSEEQVIARDPDYIVTTTDFVGELNGAEEIFSRGSWSDIAAVNAGKVMLADYNMFTRPAPRLLEAAKQFAEFVAD